MLCAQELEELVAWAFSEHDDVSIQELGDFDAWIFAVLDGQELLCYRASLSLDLRWTLSPVY